MVIKCYILFIYQTGIDPDENVDILDDLPDEFFADADEPEDMKELLQEFVMTPYSSDSLPLPINKPSEEVNDTRRLTRVATILQRVYEVQSKAMGELARIIEGNPSIESLAKILIPQNIITAFKLPINHNVTNQLDSTKPSLKPLQMEINSRRIYKCSICNYVYNSWAKVDKHMRTSHLKLKYGPCPHCKIFETYNNDSWRHHVNRRCPSLPVLA